MFGANDTSLIQMRSGPNLPGVGNFMPIGQMIALFFFGEYLAEIAAAAPQNHSLGNI